MELRFSPSGPVCLALFTKSPIRHTIYGNRYSDASSVLATATYFDPPFHYQEPFGVFSNTRGLLVVNLRLNE